MSSARALPEGCPPSGHIPANGTFYRLTWPSAKLGDVLPKEAWVLPIDTKTSDSYQRYDQCEAYAFSICAEIDDLINARRLIPWARKKSISRLDLTPDMGVVLKTPSPVGDSHHELVAKRG